MMLPDWLRTGPLLTDGAWGTELQKLGLAAGEPGDAWNIRHPQRVESVARAYVEAGSRAILTNTFRANPLALAAYGLAGECAVINAAGVRISRAAAGTRARVIASIGPSGKMLAAGEFTPGELEAAFAAQAGALAAAGPDALLIETMSDIEEARIALRSSRRTGLPVIVSFTFDTGKNKDRTMTGATPEEAAAAMAAEGADAIGANCGAGIEHLVSVCRRLRGACALPVWIKPNAGMPELVGGNVRYRQTPEQFAAHAPALLEAGVAFLGGCCGTTPEFIRALAARMPAPAPGAAAHVCD